jgi:hypothetical protein
MTELRTPEERERDFDAARDSECVTHEEAARLLVLLDRLTADFAALDAEITWLEDEQIAPLADILLSDFGGPICDESACKMAVRVLREQQARLALAEAVCDAASQTYDNRCGIGEAEWLRGFLTDIQTALSAWQEATK